MYTYLFRMPDMGLQPAPIFAGVWEPRDISTPPYQFRWWVVEVGAGRDAMLMRWNWEVFMGIPHIYIYIYLVLYIYIGMGCSPHNAHTNHHTMHPQPPHNAHPTTTQCNSPHNAHTNHLCNTEDFGRSGLILARIGLKPSSLNSPRPENSKRRASAEMGLY